MVISDCHVALSSGQLSVILLDFSHNYMHNYFSHGSLFLEMLSLLGPRALALFFILLHTLFFISSLCWIMVVSYSQSFNPDWVIKPSDLLCSLYKVIICSLIASVSRFYIQLPHLRLSNIFPQPRTVLISRLRSLFNSSTYICNIRHKN